MAYNPYGAVNAIYKLKGQWNSADTAGDETKRNETARKAREYYKQLRDNGYSSVADELAAANYTQANDINRYYAKTDRTPTRSYLYSLGKAYGMSQNEMDKLIEWDNDTGEISFGGKKIGRPDAVADGTSYWNDTSALDNAFNDYIDRSGTVRSKSTAVDQENEKLFKKYSQEYEDLRNTDPFETDEAKSILAKYDLAGLQGRDNAVASNAGSNGGNIDSFAAANALRQQASLVNQGQQVVLEAYQQKLDHARNLLSDMGVNIDRVYNQDETSKNNDVARKSEIASVTGYAPDEWVASNNPYLSDDGTIKDEYKDIDFSVVMANAKAAGNTDAYNAAAAARYYKIMGDYGAYGQYDDGNYIAPKQQKTEAAREYDESIAASDRALNADIAMNAANNQNNIDQITAQSQANIDQINANARANKSSASSVSGSSGTSHTGSASSSGSSVSGTKEGNDGGATIGKEGLERLDKFVAWVNENSALRDTYGDLVIRNGNGYKLNNKGGYLASWIYDNLANDSTLTTADKKWMIAELGISADSVDYADSNNYQARRT